MLSGLSAEVHDFLLSTSVLERLCASLCDEVTGTTGAARLLREIEVSNAFLIALDNRREWYRYHHLFRDLLRNELQFTDPGRVVDVNRRAGRWLRERGEASEAILHTIAAGDLTEAVELVASSWRPLSYTGGHQTVEAWLSALPREVRRGDARLCVASAVVAIGSGRADEVAPWVELAATAPAAGPFYDGFPSGPAAAACLRSVEHVVDRRPERVPPERPDGLGRRSGTDLMGPVHQHLAGRGHVLAREHVRRHRAARGRPRAVSHGDGAPRRRRQADDAGTADAVSHEGRRPVGGATAVACLGMLGLVHVMEGDIDKAQQYADAAISLSRRSGLEEYWVNAAAHTARGTLLAQAGRAEEARNGAGPRV